jgi:ABC-type dipeptide/oligopeptide/nickel transport system ATPase component
VQRLNVRFGPVHAVRNVSFSIQRGETVGVVGESGSGKSTTMLAILGLHPKKQTDIVADRLALGGDDLAHASEQAMRDIRGRKVAVIFQDPLAALNPLYTAGYQIAEVLIRHRDMERRSSCSTASAFRMPPVARSNIPISSRAACVSAS